MMADHSRGEAPAALSWTPEYHRMEREWYLWNGREALCDEHGDVQLFTTAKDAYDWLADQVARR